MPLCEALRRRCAPYPCVDVRHGDVMSFVPEDRYDLVFLGGMLMYLNEDDVIALLRRVIPFLEPGGIILCRESTVRNGVVMRQGEYEAVYRSVATYAKIFAACGLSTVRVEKNAPYVLLQMGCEVVTRWKRLVPRRLQAVPIVGRLVYWALRLVSSWLPRIPAAFGVAVPRLENHFWVLRTGAGGRPTRATGETGSS